MRCFTKPQHSPCDVLSSSTHCPPRGPSEGTLNHCPVSSQSSWEKAFTSGQLYGIKHCQLLSPGFEKPLQGSCAAADLQEHSLDLAKNGELIPFLWHVGFCKPGTVSQCIWGRPGVAVLAMGHNHWQLQSLIQDQHGVFRYFSIFLCNISFFP